MEKEITKIYNRAADEISKKWYEYMESHEDTLKSSYEQLQTAKRSGDKEEIKNAQDEYDRVVRNVTLNNDKYKAMLNETTTRLAHTNEIALDYVNGNIPKIYTLNYNEFASQDVDGYSFTLVNERAVKNLASEDKSLLPKKKLDVPKDKLWNTKNINSELLQGILQGENITKIAGRLAHVTDMNKASSIRNARTMTTSAENKGRQDSFKKASDDGVIMKRVWVATGDDRTRAAHKEIDGVEVDVDEPWENEYGEIMYPGDPSADPCNVYNCRCSIRAHVVGFVWNQKTEEQIEEESRYIDYSDMVNKSVETANSIDKVQKNIDSAVDKISFLNHISKEETKDILDNRISDIVKESEVGISINKDNLIKALEDGSFRNVYETGTSMYNVNTKFRDEAESMMFGITRDNTKASDRPIYGALMPRLEGGLRAENYYAYGPISKYGDGITVILNKDAIKDSSTLTLGDSLNYAGRIGVTSLSDPKFSGIYNKTGAARYLFEGANLMDVADDLDHYFEVQIYGSNTHSIENISSVVISKSRVENVEDLIRRLEDKGISVKTVK